MAAGGTRVIGIGSPAGDDCVGWMLIEALRAQPRLARRADLELLALDRPGPALIAHLQGVARVILVDALHVGSGEDTSSTTAVARAGLELRTGAVIELDPAVLDDDAGACSGHALGVGAALRLAGVLGALPPALHLLAVAAGEVAPPVRAGCGRAAALATMVLSPAMCAALPLLVARVEALIDP